jgi:hypothetical protein
MELFNKLKTAAGAVSDTVKNAYAGGVDSVAAMLADINSASADLNRVGYVVTDIEVYVGLPPGVTVFLAKERDATAEEFAAVSANNADNLTARTLLGLVQQADHWIGKLKLSGRHCRLVAVELGLRPGVRLIYSRQRSELALADPLLQTGESP